MDLESFQQQALPFEFDEHFDPNKSPENGEEYLQRVIMERKRCPRIVCKEPNKLFNEIGIQKMCNPNIINNDISDTAPIQLRTTKEWQQFQIEDFTKLQNKIINLRNKFKNCSHSEVDKNIKIPKIPIFILSTNWNKPVAADEHEINCDEEWYEFCKSNEPFLSIMFSLDQRTLEYLIELLLNWLNKELKCDENVVDHNKLNVLDWIGKWIYSGLACLLLPLEPYMHSILRDIAKLLIKIRNQLTADDYDKALPLNLLICVISNNFEQLDLSIVPINEY